MGILIDVTRSKIYHEFNSYEQQQFFSISKSKVVSHIDTLYYSIFLKDDIKGNVFSGIIEMIEDLTELRESIPDHENSLYYDFQKDIVLKKRRFSIYDLCLSIEGLMDIFISKSVPNNNTPRILVQLRSIGLWTLGENELVLYSYEIITEILKRYDIEVNYCQENRIDYCYHTNAIQNPVKMYSDDSLSNSLYTTFQIYNKVGRKYDKNLTVEYLSLGNRSSNNVFFRSYNKTREVVEMGYKNFFLELWLNLNLISQYDFYIYSKAFESQNYYDIYRAMLDFYLEFGRDEVLKTTLQQIKNKKSSTIEEIKNIITGICPMPTLILNIEFQTMRKFYSNADDLINSLPVHNLNIPFQLSRIFKIIDNRKIYLDYLTSKTVSFRRENWENEENEKYIYKDFWYRIRTCKQNSLCEKNFKRNYSKEINFNLLVKKIKGNLATLSLYNGHNQTNLQEDLSLFMSIINDNDIEMLENGKVKYRNNDYAIIKDKKKKALKSMIELIHTNSKTFERE